ncbi:hypothetical protein LTV02_07095 [Nocardia yamanashiensis]|uniref:hypothetical protein n=1 Tax=Nocardia yamanashiensis TaxID=209247 RepID=UPI001E4D9DF8|nr:hypothetical protein [Nocardia yamanashiensis]UGT43149.1 hypothetical protein LTV02_07095 [Nocardia yamanashiensis]
MAAGRGAPRRHTVLVSGLLIALLVVAAIADCVLLRGESHPHTAIRVAPSVPAASPTPPAVVHGHPATVHAITVVKGLSGAAEDCGPHLWHCLKSALPTESTAQIAVLSPWVLLAFLLPVLAAAAAAATERGPPGPWSAVVSGRMLLTRLCIARR